MYASVNFGKVWEDLKSDSGFNPLVYVEERDHEDSL